MKHLISRRNLLRGVGVCLALPWLESLALSPARAGVPGGPKRFLLVTYPNGAPDAWWKTALAFGTTVKGADFTLPVVLDPFAKLKSKMLMVSRLGNYTWRKDMDKPDPFIEPAHSRLVAAMTTCVDADAVAKANGANDLSSAVFNGVSVDQLIAQKADLGKTTSIPSLQTGLGVKPGFFDYRSYAYNQAVSWKSKSEPLKRQVNPKAVFDALVAGGAVSSTGAPDGESVAAAKLRVATEQSVIDSVRDDANSLLSRVSTRDRSVLQEYLDSLRGIEKQVASVAATMPGALGCNPIGVPGAVPEPPGPQQGLNQGDDGYDHEAHADVMNDLIAMAIQCDVTRVVTHMLDDARSEFEYRHIPAADREKVGLKYNEGAASTSTLASTARGHRLCSGQRHLPDQHAEQPRFHGDQLLAQPQGLRAGAAARLHPRGRRHGPRPHRDGLHERDAHARSRRLRSPHRDAGRRRRLPARRPRRLPAARQGSPAPRSLVHHHEAVLQDGCHQLR